MRSELTISHVADFYRRYPGEMATFYTRVDARQSLPALTVRVSLPPGLEPEDARIVTGAKDWGGDVNALLEIEPEGEGEASHFFWQTESPAEPPAGTRAASLPSGWNRYEFQVRARVAPTGRDVTLESRAATVCDAAQCMAEETVAVAVSARGRYLDYLPAFYHDDGLMSRFLMVFESFWAPIERQIDHLPFYFDPRLTPADFLPWLASWLNLTLDERWPEEKRRRLVCAAVSLYRKRGTRRGVQEFLALYTGKSPRIIEHRAENFCLGDGALLGPGVALGLDNKPHTFTVALRLPPLPAVDEEERGRKEADRRRIIESIIESEKPAHAGYNLRLEIE